jgi:transcriptional regulator with XRE-family HTH domain
LCQGGFVEKLHLLIKKFILIVGILKGGLMKAPIGSRLRRIRRAKDLTQEQLATQAGLNVITISRLENGTAKAVYADTVAALATTLRISADYLLGLTDKEEAHDSQAHLTVSRDPNERRFHANDSA